MDRSKLTVIDRFASQVEADLAKSALESAGIDAMIQSDRAGGMRDHLAWSGLGFKVLVREEDAAEAHDVLQLPPEELVSVQVFGTQAEADTVSDMLLSAGIVANDTGQCRHSHIPDLSGVGEQKGRRQGSLCSKAAH